MAQDQRDAAPDRRSTHRQPSVTAECGAVSDMPKRGVRSRYHSRNSGVIGSFHRRGPQVGAGACLLSNGVH